MDTSSEHPQQNDDENNAASISLPKVIDSPKTPVRKPLDDSLEDYDSEEMESPNFPHLIPVYNRRKSNDFDGVRIGWDDGYGSVCFEDDDYGAERNGRRYKRSRSGRLFTERHHRSLFCKDNVADSPSPNRAANNAVIQEELNDYLGCILSCLSAKKKNRQLMKLKSESTSSNDLKDNNNISHLLNDSTEDEMMLRCSQAIEQTISFDANYNTVESNKLVKSNNLSIVGISPLNSTSTNSTLSNDNYHQSIKKFKPETQCKQTNKKLNKNFQSKCCTITSNTGNKSQKETNTCSVSSTNTVNNTNQDILLNDSFGQDDDLFSALDLSAIEQQVLSNVKEPASVITQINDPVCTKQHKNLTLLKGSDCTNSLKSSVSNNNSSSVLWRRCNSSSSIVNKTLQAQQSNKPICGVKETTAKINVNTGSTRYCTPAEIEEKRNRARRTLMLKFKSKNKSAL